MPYSMIKVCIREMKTTIRLLKSIIMFHIFICTDLEITFSLINRQVIKYKNITINEMGTNSYDIIIDII